jgi:hypothetical protein
VGYSGRVRAARARVSGAPERGRREAMRLMFSAYAVVIVAGLAIALIVGFAGR